MYPIPSDFDIGFGIKNYIRPAKPEKYNTKIENIQDALNIYFTHTILENAKCSGCRGADRTEEYFIYNPPQYLIIRQLRNDETSESPYKLDVNIINSLEIDISNYVIYNSSDSKPITKYNLIAAIVHSGTSSGGHYKAYAKYTNDKGIGIWYKINDSAVTPNIDVREVERCCALVLFYEKASKTK